MKVTSYTSNEDIIKGINEQELAVIINPLKKQKAQGYLGSQAIEWQKVMGLCPPPFVNSLLPLPEREDQCLY